MTDGLSPARRSRAMSKVRGADTKPEWILRCGLHRLGFRYRLRDPRLPGRPDLVFPKFRAAVFVHGCYWHRHPGCKDASTPKSNVAFWTRKFAENVARDDRTRSKLESLGWRSLVVWECELTRHTVEAIRAVAAWLVGEQPGANVPSGEGGTVDRRLILAIAEEKVRYRIASYDETPGSEGSD